MATTYTASELAAMRLPDMPTSARAIRRRALADGWATVAEAGVVRIVVTSLPEAAQRAVALRAPARPGVMSLEADGVTNEHREIGRGRVRVVAKMAELVESGRSVRQAADAVCGSSARSARRWYAQVQGLPRGEWWAALTPRYSACATTEGPECHEAAWAWLLAHYLRSERPSFAVSYKDLRHTAERTHREWLPLPSYRSLLRRLQREVPTTVQTYRRLGPEVADQRFVPAQRRDPSQLRPLEVVIADGHRLDVMVAWPTANGGVKLERPIVLGWKDAYSGMWLGWAVDSSETSDLVRRSFARLATTWGIPERAMLDNGRAFAAKKITGGTATRYRFRVREEDEQGLLTALGVRVHWTLPYNGRAKPIEKAWRDDLVTRFARDPEFSGAYLGSTIDARPHDYDPKKAVPAARLLELLDAHFIRMNQETGRRSRVCAGRSFEETFLARYAEGPVTKPTEEQRRLLLLASRRVGVAKFGSTIELHGTRFAGGFALAEYSGAEVVVRYDADDLSAGLLAYTVAGAFITRCEAITDVAFGSERDAETHARSQAAQRRALRDAAREVSPVTHPELAADLRKAAGLTPAAKVSPKVVRMPTKRIAPPTAPSPVAPTAAEAAAQESAFALIDAAGAAAFAALGIRR